MKRFVDVVDAVFVILAIVMLIDSYRGRVIMDSDIGCVIMSFIAGYVIGFLLALTLNIWNSRPFK
jgi:hypothetical protein